MRTSRLLLYLFSLLVILTSVLVVNIIDSYSPTSYTTYTGSQVPIRSSAEFAGEGKLITYEKRFRGLQPGKLYDIKVIKEGQQRYLPFESAEFMVKETKREAIITFKKPTQLPSALQAPLAEKLISYGQIVISSPQEVSDKISVADLENTAITFSVEKSFLKFQDADESSVKLFLLSGGGWSEVSLTRLPEGGLLYYYKAQVPFGTYAITYGVKEEVEEIEEIVPTGPACGNLIPEAGENCATCPADIQCGVGESCQSGVCIKPPAPVAQQQPVAPPPRVRTAKKGFNWVWVLIPAIIIVMVLIVVLLIRRPKGAGFELEQVGVAAQPAQPVQQAQAQPTQPAQQPATNQLGIEQRASAADPRVNQIKGYISDVLGKGFSKEQVKSTLTAKGWPADVIDKAFSELGK